MSVPKPYCLTEVKRLERLLHIEKLYEKNPKTKMADGLPQNKIDKTEGYGLNKKKIKNSDQTEEKENNLSSYVESDQNKLSNLMAEQQTHDVQQSFPNFVSENPPKKSVTDQQIKKAVIELNKTPHNIDSDPQTFEKSLFNPMKHVSREYKSRAKEFVEKIASTLPDTIFDFDVNGAIIINKETIIGSNYADIIQCLFSNNSRKCNIFSTKGLSEFCELVKQYDLSKYVTNKSILKKFKFKKPKNIIEDNIESSVPVTYFGVNINDV